MNFKKYLIVCSLIAFSFQINAHDFGWSGSFGGDGEDMINAAHIDSGLQNGFLSAQSR